MDNEPKCLNKRFRGLDKYEKELVEAGISLEDISNHWFFLWDCMISQWWRDSLSLSELVEHLDELVTEYDSCFEMGFCDVSMNIRIAIKKICEKYYPDRLKKKG